MSRSDAPDSNGPSTPDPQLGTAPEVVGVEVPLDSVSRGPEAAAGSLAGRVTKFMSEWESGSIPFLNKPFLKFAQLALVLGAGAVLADNYFVPDEVRTGVDITSFTDSFSRGDMTDIGSETVGSLKPRYIESDRWLQLSAGFGTEPRLENVFAVSQDQAVLFRRPVGTGATFALVSALVAPTSVEARITGPAIDAGLVFRYVDDKNWWAVVNDPLRGRYRILRTLDGVTEEVGDTGTNSMVGASDVLTVAMDDDGFKIYQNGSPIVQVLDDSLANEDAKSAGLFALSQRSIGARWDDFVLRAPSGVTKKTPILEVDTNALTPRSIRVPETPLVVDPLGPTGASAPTAPTTPLDTPSASGSVSGPTGSAGLGTTTSTTVSGASG